MPIALLMIICVLCLKGVLDHFLQCGASSAIFRCYPQNGLAPLQAELCVKEVQGNPIGVTEIHHPKHARPPKTEVKCWLITDYVITSRRLEYRHSSPLVLPHQNGQMPRIHEVSAIDVEHDDPIRRDADVPAPRVDLREDPVSPPGSRAILLMPAPSRLRW